MSLDVQTNNFLPSLSSLGVKIPQISIDSSSSTIPSTYLNRDNFNSVSSMVKKNQNLDPFNSNLKCT